MGRNGFAAVSFFLFMILANFSDASLLANLRKFVVRKDSLPGSPVPLPGPLTEEKKANSKALNESKSGNKLNLNVVDESSKGNELNSGSEKPKSEDKNPDPNGVSGTDKDKKLVTKPIEGGSEENNLDSEPADGTGTGKKSNSEQGKETSKQDKSDPKPNGKSNSNPVEEPSEENKKSGTESVKDKGKQERSDPAKVNETGNQKPAPPVTKDSQGTNNSNGTGTANSPPPGGKPGKEEEKKKINKEEKSDTGTVTDESCDGVSPSCTIQDLTGCIKSSDDGSKVVVLVQNKGESNLKAVVAEENDGKGLESEIPKKRSKMIPISLANGKASNTVIVLHGANSQCTLPLHPLIVEENSFLRFPTYDKLITPVNGAYFIVLTALIFGGTFICIKFSKKRRQGSGIPYQELEMGLPESVSAADVETAEGWDQGWDDDWDNDSAVKSPAARHAGSISANGLTSRSPIKDGWEDTWDD